MPNDFIWITLVNVFFALIIFERVARIIFNRQGLSRFKVWGAYITLYTMPIALHLALSSQNIVWIAGLWGLYYVLTFYSGQIKHSFFNMKKDVLLCSLMIGISFMTVIFLSPVDGLLSWAIASVVVGICLARKEGLPWKQTLVEVFKMSIGFFFIPLACVFATPFLKE